MAARKRAVDWKDPDLSTPQHDAIMFWLDENVERFLQDPQHPWLIWDAEETQRLRREIEADLKKAAKALEDAIDSATHPHWKTHAAPPFGESRLVDLQYGSLEETRRGVEERRSWTLPIPPPRPAPRLLTKIWEQPVKGGFVDLCVSLQHSRLTYMVPKEHPGIVTHESVWMPNTTVRPSWGVREDGRTDTYYFEVKPRIPSLGEVIRQVRKYQDGVWCGHHGNFFIVSPDNTFEAKIREQGIGFLQCPASLLEPVSQKSKEDPNV